MIVPAMQIYFCLDLVCHRIVVALVFLIILPFNTKGVLRNAAWMTSITSKNSNLLSKVAMSIRLWYILYSAFYLQVVLLVMGTITLKQVAP
jgi:hypothetical protein